MKNVNRELKNIINSMRKYIETERTIGPGEIVLSDYGKGYEKTGLGSLKEEVSSCKKCALHRTRKNPVFGAGSSSADLMFVGEAPGMEEDLQGLPFVGRAGQLLTKIIEAMGLSRKDVYIANILKCRPPNNRNPLPTEILECEAYLFKQIDLIRPRIICALGKFAAQTLLRSQEPITRLRGKFYEYHGVRLMPTFHPAYLLRNPGDKRLVWEDMKKIRKVLNGK